MFSAVTVTDTSNNAKARAPAGRLTTDVLLVSTVSQRVKGTRPAHNPELKEKGRKAARMTLFCTSCSVGGKEGARDNAARSGGNGPVQGGGNI